MADFFPVLGLTRADVEACGITGSGLNTINPTDEEMEWMARDFKRFLLGEGATKLEILGQYFEYKYSENRKTENRSSMSRADARRRGTSILRKTQAGGG